MCVISLWQYFKIFLNDDKYRSCPYLKQQYVTLTAAYGFEKQTFTKHVNKSLQTAISVKLGHILWKLIEHQKEKQRTFFLCVT